MFQENSDSDYIVFYADQVYSTSSKWTQGYALPDGAYQLAPGGYWYIIKYGGNMSIPRSDVPPELRTLCLLLGISY